MKTTIVGTGSLTKITDADESRGANLTGTGIYTTQKSQKTKFAGLIVLDETNRMSTKGNATSMSSIDKSVNQRERPKEKPHQNLQAVIKTRQSQQQMKS